MIDERAIGDRYRAVAGEFNERQRRVWAGAEALSHGRGGQAAVVRATGMSPTTVAKGMREVRWGRGRGGAGARPGRRSQAVDADRRPAARRLGSTGGPVMSAATRSRRCSGRARASDRLRGRSGRRGIRSATRRSRGFCATWATACRPTARPGRGPRTRTATLNSSTSTRHAAAHEPGNP